MTTMRGRAVGANFIRGRRCASLVALGGALALTGCQRDVMVTIHRPEPTTERILAVPIRLRLVAFADARPADERALIGRSESANLSGKYSLTIHTSSDVAAGVSLAIRGELDRAGFAIDADEPGAADPPDALVVGGSVVRLWIEVRRDFSRTCVTTASAEVTVRVGGVTTRGFFVGKDEWSAPLSSPDARDFEEMLQRALSDLAAQVSRFVVGELARRANGAPATGG